MDSGFENAQEEPRDRTKWVWLGVAAAVVAMVVLLWLTQKPTSSVSLVRVKHILVAANMSDPADRQRALEQVKELRERILKGESFAKIAREFSNDPVSSVRGGDLGFSQRGAYEDTFEKHVWTAKEGELSRPVQTGRGFHLIVVVDRNLSKADKYEQELAERARQNLNTQSRGVSATPTPPPAPAP